MLVQVTTAFVLTSTDSLTNKITQGAKLVSSAAYLLFYRRRSDKPLGPQYLQDLVTEFRNPPAEAACEDATADDESGEDRLGGPAPSSQHGSSSALVEAGVGATSNQMGSGGSGGAGAAVRLLTQGPMTNSEDRMFGNVGNNGWGFDGIDETNGAGDSLLDAVDDNGDADSTKAQYEDVNDNDSGFGGDTMDLDLEQHSFDGYEDDSNVFHVEHAPEMPGHVDATGHVTEEDPPAADIVLSDSPPEQQSKMD